MPSQRTGADVDGGVDVDGIAVTSFRMRPLDMLDVLIPEVSYAWASVVFLRSPLWIAGPPNDCFPKRSRNGQILDVLIL